MFREKRMEENRNISIIITTTDKDTMLRETLPVILAQEYGAEYEVVVARETRQGEVRDIVEPLQKEYHNLKTTFLPDKPQYVSDEEVKILLAVKAARYDNIVMMPPSMTPQTVKWLEELAETILDGGQSLSDVCPALFGDGHCHKKLGILKRLRHKRRVMKALKQWCGEKGLKRKELFLRGDIRHTLIMTFKRRQYLCDMTLRDIICRHTDIYIR